MVGQTHPMAETNYRFRNSLGDLVDERTYASHDEALQWAVEQEELDDEIVRVEYQDADRGDWRWAGPLPL